MGPIAAIWARAMRDRGHSVEVVTAHPHYPPGIWGQRFLPMRELRDGIRVLRLPLWLGHATTLARVREEMSYALAAGLAMPVGRTPHVVVCVSPSFLALAPMALNVRARRVPLVIWLQDILPDAAATTGLVRNRLVLRSAWRLERAAYRAARRIVVISETFRENLRRKGVLESKLELVYNPATRGFGRRRDSVGEARILWIGNIGYSQGLPELVRAFEAHGVSSQTRLVIAGHGELAEAVRAEIRSDRVELLGLVDDRRLDEELERATLGLVSQRSDIEEFNVPSRLMTLMARGVPVLAVSRSESEVTRIVRESGGGWTGDAARPDLFPALVSETLADADEVERRSEAAHAYAARHFAPEVFGDRFTALLEELRRAAAIE